jgi:hypothetical protein
MPVIVPKAPVSIGVRPYNGPGISNTAPAPIEANQIQALISQLEGASFNDQPNGTNTGANAQEYLVNGF